MVLAKGGASHVRCDQEPEEEGGDGIGVYGEREGEGGGRSSGHAGDLGAGEGGRVQTLPRPAGCS